MNSWPSNAVILNSYKVSYPICANDPAKFLMSISSPSFIAETACQSLPEREEFRAV